MVTLLAVLSVAGAFADLAVLLCIVRSLLLISDNADRAALGIGSIATDLSFAQLLFIAAGAGIISIAARSAESVLVGRLSGRAAATARRRLIDSYFAADWRALANIQTGQLQQLLGTNSQYVSASVVQLAAILSVCINLAVYWAFVLVASPIVALLFILVGALAGGALTLLRTATRRAAKESADLVGAVQLEATSLAALKRELQLFDVQEAARSALVRTNDAARRSLTRIRTLQRLGPSVFQQVVMLLVIGVVAVARAADIPATSFGSAAILAVRSLSFLQQLTTNTQNFIEVRPYLDQLREAIEDQQAKVRILGSAVLDGVRKLELDEVSFAYDETAVLRRVSLRAEEGEWIGLVGPSGGGKSTIVNLLARLLEPLSGEYRVNGRIASEFSAETWANHFALLSQEPALIRGSVEENIRFFRHGNSAAARRAASLAAVDSDIERMTDGYETAVGDGQASVSGGQRQRIALARSLFRNPQVLILDEPTSALDAANEQLIEAAIESLPSETIVVVVSHRASLLRRCDRFYAIEDGQVVATGSADDIDLARYVAPRAVGRRTAAG